MSDSPCEKLVSGELHRILKFYKRGDFGTNEAAAVFNADGGLITWELSREEWKVPVAMEVGSDKIYVHTHPAEAKPGDPDLKLLLSMSDMIGAARAKVAECAMSTLEDSEVVIDCVDGKKIDKDKALRLAEFISEVYSPEGKGYLGPEEAEESTRIQNEIAEEAGCRENL